MVTTATIEKTLEQGDLTARQSRAIAEAIELSQRKTQEEIETSLREWMKDRFFTKEDGARLEIKIVAMEGKLAETKAELLKWMFIFWVGQIGIMAALLKLLK